MKKRLDIMVIERGVAQSRERGRALIMEGKVLVDSIPVTKAGAMIKDEAIISLKEPDIPFVSRGGVKLQGALEEFKVGVKDNIAIDIGASTGGFTDCLLKAGARRVYAVDVGYGQLDWTLRNDPRVVMLEKTNIRHLERSSIADELDIAVIDVSFISLRLVLPKAVEFVRPGGEIIALVKPQFEVGVKDVGKGGIVRDSAKRQSALNGIVEFAIGLSLQHLGTIDSPITGQKGNMEFLIHLRKG